MTDGDTDAEGWTAMTNKIGLALSGGGFRASLYHLGLVRFLRDAGILTQVTHITSVSGGSILAAHLVLNWERYNGSSEEFDKAASEFLAFVRLDVRNRITRRFPLTIPLRWLRKLAGLSNRKLTRTGLLEHYYEKHLYGDVSLFELPEKPKLHLLTTNVSEGCLCSYNREGLLMVRREKGINFRLDLIRTGLATVPMAVTASSAFPGFFPPIELTGAEVGVTAGEFGRQAYTDGGVFDNLGVRMFRYLERQILAESPLSRDDFFDFQSALDALRQASDSKEETPLRRVALVLGEAGRSGEDSPLRGLAVVLDKAMRRGDPLVNPGGVRSGAGKPDGIDRVLSGLWKVMRHYQFQREPLFAGLKPVDPDAEALLLDSRADGQVLDVGDQLWLNRHLLEAAFRQATGRPCFRRLNSGLDGVLVSDVGKPIKVTSGKRAVGLIKTALRATDILMDRVWQLENETFRDTPGFVFAPITDVVDPAEDSTVMHPEIQRQIANIRTDLDGFSMLEISSLVRHGYCVGRKACRSRPDLFGPDLPDDAPWDPIPQPLGAATATPAADRRSRPGTEPSPTTVEARTLQASALRRVFSTLLDRRDWATYVYVPLLVPIMVLLPYFIHEYYVNSRIESNLVQSLSQGSRDLEQMTRLLEDGTDARWTGAAADEVDKLEEPDFTGFQILQDSRILDLRHWGPGASRYGSSGSYISSYRRMKVYKLPGNTEHTLFRFPLGPQGADVQVQFPPQELPAKLVRTTPAENAIEKSVDWQVIYDLRKVPPGQSVDLLWEYQLPWGIYHPSENSTTHGYDVVVETAELTQWILMPTGKLYKNFDFIRYQKGKPETAEPARAASEFLTEDATVLAYKLLGLKPGYSYENVWYYK